jgi:hypothetical protein
MGAEKPDSVKLFVGENEAMPAQAVFSPRGGREAPSEKLAEILAHSLESFSFTGIHQIRNPS